tara:strand:+ start:7616 stop:8509 length:894 start_codon:yes stop_codon:yes gene_type:complete
MTKHKACIAILSSRQRTIKLCLDNLWSSFNNKYGYPVYIYYFDDIYDSAELRKNICSNTKQKIIFKQVPYSSPENVSESDMFYNKMDNWYARTRFSINRKGYLHMINFKCNMMNYENTNFHDYKYVFVLDDESGFTKEINFDPFQSLYQNKYSMGSFYTQEREREPSQGQICTTMHFWNLAKKFIEDNNIDVKSEHIKNLFLDPDAPINVNRLPIFSMRVVDTDLLKSEQWLKWLDAINESGGIYKHRWGDDDIYTMFCLINNIEIVDYNTIEGECFNTQHFRSIQGFAPSVKEMSR